MVDISIEILASSVPVRDGCSSKYRVKTWWAHIDVPPDKSLIKLPRLPMIQQYLIMTGKDTTVFVETWQDEKHCFDKNIGRNEEDSNSIYRPKFLGMTVCSVDDQLRNPNLNPSVQWLDVRDPVENIQKGKLLLKIDARFALPSSNEKARVENAPSDLLSPPKREFNSRRTIAADFSRSPSRRNCTSCFSAQSDVSVVSAASISSSLSQGVQTDLSLPVLPDISKFARILAASTSQSTSEEVDYSSKKSFSNQRPHLPRQCRRSLSDSSSLILDPLQIAEDILYRNITASSQKGRGPSNDNNDLLKTSGSFRRDKNVLIKPRHHQLATSKDKLNAKNYDLEAVVDVIDILNPIANSESSTPSQSRKQNTFTNDHSRHFHPGQEDEVHIGDGDKHRKHKQQTSKEATPVFHNNDNICPTKVRLAPEGSSSLQKESVVGSRIKITPTEAQRNVKQSEVSNEEDFGNLSQEQPRFKEVHFDGAKAQQQASALLMAQAQSSKPFSSDSKPPHPISRRRIAAAIFDNDNY